MECNKEEAEKCKALSEANFKRQDLVGAKKYALKARRLFPELEGLPQLLSVLEVHIAAHRKLKSGESNCYGILQVDCGSDDNTIRKQYRKLALILHPDKNKAFGAEAAFKHISEAWSVLSDRDKKLRFDKRWREDMAAHASPRVSTFRVNMSKSPNTNSAHQGQAHVHPQQGAHAHQQQGHVNTQQQQQQQQQQQHQGQAHVYPQQGPHAHQQQGNVKTHGHGQAHQQGQGYAHGQAHVQHQQGQGQGHGFQQQGQGQAHGFQQQWKGHAHAYQGQAYLFQQGHGLSQQQQWQGPYQGQGQAHVPRQQGQGQGQAHAPQQQERDHVRAPEQQGQSQGHVHQQRQGQVHAQHQQEQRPVHAQRQQGQDTTQAQGQAHQAPVPQKNHAHKQHEQGQVHVPQQQGQGPVHTHQQQGQNQAHVHPGQGQHGHVQQGQGQVPAQHQQEQGPVHAHQQQGQDTTQAQCRPHQAPGPQKHHAHEQHVQGQGHFHQQQGQGLAHTHQQQGQDPTQARDEAHQTAAPQNHHAEHNQAHASKPSQPAFQHSKSTFWTACPSCRMQLEYERTHMDKKLCCPMCYKAFVSKEIAPVQGTVLWPRPISTDAGIKSSWPDTRFDGILSTGSTLPSSVHSNKKAKMGAEVNLHRQHGQKLPESPAQPAQKPVELQQKGLGSLKKYELRKKVVMHAKEGLERHIVRSKDVIAQKLSEEKERKAAAHKVSAIEQDQTADKERSALASGQNEPVAAGKEGYVHNTEEKAIDADACNSRVRTRNSTGSRKEARVSQESPCFMKSKPAGTGISKVALLQRKRKLASPMDKSIEDQNEGDSTFIKWCESYGGSQKSKVFDEISVQVDVADETANGCKMEVPDPDFHNFDGDRTEHHFAPGQIWASYDDDDGMPRYYTRVNKILSLQPLKMQMNWLEVRNPSDETRAWLDSGFQHSCGDFQLGTTYIAEEVSTFSHLMWVDKCPKGGYKIYPRQGDVWAVYKDWEILEVKEDKQGYDMVEIVAAFDEDRGLQVSPLFKVAGFKTIFERKTGEDHVRWIPPQELRRFSHQVPAHHIAAGKVPRIRVDCLELDPASTPMNLIYGKQ